MRNFFGGATLVFGAFAVSIVPSLGFGAPVEMTGEFRVTQADDFQGKKTERQYHLKETKSGKIFRLHFSSALKREPRTGDKVRIKGNKNGENIEVAAGSISGATATELQTAGTSAAPAVSGIRSVLAIVVNFQDAAVSCSTSSVNTLLFGSSNSVASTFADTSHGVFGISGTVVGPYTIRSAWIFCRIPIRARYNRC